MSTFKVFVAIAFILAAVFVARIWMLSHVPIPTPLDETPTESPIQGEVESMNPTARTMVTSVVEKLALNQPIIPIGSGYEAPMVWRIYENEISTPIEVIAMHYALPPMPLEEFRSLETQFKAEMETDLLNAADGPTGGQAGYRLGEVVCLLEWHFTEVSTSEDEPVTVLSDTVASTFSCSLLETYTQEA